VFQPSCQTPSAYAQTGAQTGAQAAFSVGTVF